MRMPDNMTNQLSFPFGDPEVRRQVASAAGTLVGGGAVAAGEAGGAAAVASAGAAVASALPVVLTVGAVAAGGYLLYKFFKGD